MTEQIEHVFVGNVYERRDGRKCFVYGFECIHNTYQCVVEETGELFSVYEDGKYYEHSDSHNDLVGFVK